MSAVRWRQSALLLGLAACATAAVLLFSAQTLPRAVAGVVLALLPWAAAVRLEPLRLIDLPGGRFAAGGGLALASLVLLGLLLTVTDIGLTETSAALGVALIVLALTLAGHRGDAEAAARRLSLLAAALSAIAIATVVVAFAIARGGALDGARQGSGYAAFVVADAQGHRLGLRNATERGAEFTVRISGRGRDRSTTLELGAEQLRLLPVRGAGGEPLQIRVVVRVDGRPKGRPMTLSTAALS